jgi:hypothetical protein
MKAASLKQIKDEILNYTQPELVELCLKLGRFKKENKEFMSYALFLCHDEQDFRLEMKDEMESLLNEINTSGFYLMKKTIRKVLKVTKQAIRFSDSKETEVELLLHFCRLLLELRPSVLNHKVLFNMLKTQKTVIKKAINALPEDIQYDYQKEMEEIGLTSLK